MRVTLAKELEKYYNRVGNKIVFTRALTLNRLSFEMWEQLDYKNIDPSVLSRVLSGERLFTKRQLNAFCRVLKMTEQEERRLEEVLLFEIMDRFGIEEDFLLNIGSNFIDLAGFNLEKIQGLLDNGQYSFANDFVNHVIENVHDELKLNILADKSRKILLRILGELLIAQHHVLIIAHTKQKDPFPIKRAAVNLFKIGQELKDQEFIKLADFITGNLLYIKDDCQNSLNYLKLAQGLTSHSTEKICSARALIIILARLKQRDLYEVNKKHLLSLSAGANAVYKSFIMEGIARSELYQGDYGKVQYYLSSATAAGESISPTSNEKNLSKARIIRTTMELVYNLNEDRNKKYLKKIGSEGIELTKTFGYSRHEEQIKNLMPNY